MQNPHKPRAKDQRIAAHVTDAPGLDTQIAAMERRLAVERAQVVAHSRELRGNVKRRLVSPISLVFATSVGFVAGEIMALRRPRKARPGGRTKLRQAGKSLLGGISKPLLSLLQLGSMGFLAKQSSEVRKQVAASPAEPAPPTLH